MHFAYLCFLVLWTIVVFVVCVIQTITVCKLNDRNAIATNIATLLFFIGLLAQFIADGIRVIGG